MTDRSGRKFARIGQGDLTGGCKQARGGRDHAVPTSLTLGALNSNIALDRHTRHCYTATRTLWALTPMEDSYLMVTPSANAYPQPGPCGILWSFRQATQDRNVMDQIDDT